MFQIIINLNNSKTVSIYRYCFCYIGIATATYEYDGGYIRSKNFATKYNFEPIASLLGDNDDYDKVFKTLLNINTTIAKDYLKLIAFDAIIFNVDRHNENVGILRNRKTGRIVSLAPNFDNNLAFYSNDEIILNMPQKDAMIKRFTAFINSEEITKQLFKEIIFPEISEKELYDILNKIEIKINNENNFVTTLLARYKYIKQLF